MGVNPGSRSRSSDHETLGGFSETFNASGHTQKPTQAFELNRKQEASLLLLFALSFSNKMFAFMIKIGDMFASLKDKDCVNTLSGSDRPCYHRK